MSLTFNQFQKELRDRGIEGPVAYMFTLVYERLIETENQLTACAKLLESMADTMSGFAQLSEVQQRELRKVVRGRQPDGVSVESVAWDDKDA
jgi:predicted HTH domain antitoxin